MARSRKNGRRQRSSVETAVEAATRVRSRPAYLERGARRCPRSLLSVPVTLRHLKTGEVRTTCAVSLDISEGGVGVRVPDTLHVGDTVTIDLELPAGDFKAVAIVRHTSSARSGFEFLRLTEDQRLQILFATQPKCVE